MLPTYRPSGTFTMSFATLLPAAAALGGVLGFVYQLGIHSIAFVKIAVVLWIACGFGAAGIAGLGMRLSKCRNAMIAAGAGAIIGLAAVAAGHVTEFWLQTKSVQGTMTVQEYVKARVGGGWYIGRRSASSSNSFPKKSPDIVGAGVWAVWGVEAVGILALGAWGAARMVSRPYCETCQQWAGKAIVSFAVPWAPADAADKIKQAADIDSLLAISSSPPPEGAAMLPRVPKKGEEAPPKGTEYREMAYTLTGCPVCDDFGVLTVTLVTTKQANKKQIVASRKDLAVNVLIDRAAREKVLAAARVWGGVPVA